MRSSGSTVGSIDRGIALFSIHDMKDKRSAARESDRRIWSNEINHVAATAFLESLYRVLSRNSRLKRLTISCSVLRKRDRYSRMEICIALRYAAACAIASGKNASSFNNSVKTIRSFSKSFRVNDPFRKDSASWWFISWISITSLPARDTAISR